MNFSDLRKSIILFISSSEFGAINYYGIFKEMNLLKKKLDILSPLDVNLNFQQLKETIQNRKFSGSFIFMSFITREGICSVICIFPSLLFYYVTCCFYFIIRFAI